MLWWIESRTGVQFPAPPLVVQWPVGLCRSIGRSVSAAVTSAPRAVRLLLVEDENRLAERIRAHLARQGFAVDITPDGGGAIERTRVGSYDCILLDLGLPGRLPGLEVCRQLRRDGLQTPVLIITAHDALSSRVEGLDAGADDYLVKPFALEELSARVRALLRRAARADPVVLEVADVRLDTAKRTAERGGREFTLTAREYAMLELFMRRPDEVLDRAEISRHVWDDNYDPASNIIDVYVGRLRDKLEVGGRQRLIQTLRGQGYVMREDPEGS
jgi:DNA-binding response OmpR family regulator